MPIRSALIALVALAAPAQEPELFAPGMVSTAAHETSAVFTPDGNRVYFSRADPAFLDSAILEATKDAQGQWGRVRLAPFSGTWRDTEPFVSPDGRRFFFASNRPVTPGGPALQIEGPGRKVAGSNIWYMDRTAEGWGEPVHVEGKVNGLPMVYNPTCTADGTLYFSGRVIGGPAAQQIYLARPKAGGGWGDPERLPFCDESVAFMDPAIEPEGRWMVFLKGGAGLQIVFREGGGWGKPQALATPGFGPLLGNAPCLAPGGRAFTFTSQLGRPVAFPKPPSGLEGFQKRLAGPGNGSRDIYWLSLEPWLKAKGF